MKQQYTQTAAAILALAAVSVAGVDASKLRARQYPADAPACARICIAAKIAEVVDPGLATSCDGTSGAAYVSCVCSTSKFTRAYDTCLTENCVFPADLEAGRQLFTAFCNSPSEQQISSANAVASQAIASQSSLYAAESRTASGASSGTTAASTSAASSSAISSGASSSTLATTGTTSAATSGASSSTSTDSGTSRPASGTSSTTASNASQTTSTPNTSSRSLQSSGTLGAAAVASALANATGVSSANSIYTPALLSTFGCAAIAVFFHALL